MTRYLFVCAYAQSRSKYFAERFMEDGELALFCGHNEEADFKISKHYIEWADIVILLDKDIERTIHYHYMLTEDKQIIKHYIDDEPAIFNKEMLKLQNKLAREDEYYE